LDPQKDKQQLLKDALAPKIQPQFQPQHNKEKITDTCKMKVLSSVIIFMVTAAVSIAQEEPDSVENSFLIDALKNSECTNCHRLVQSVGWGDPQNENPLLDAAAAGYDTSYNDDAVCVVKVKQQQPLVYSLIERSANAWDAGKNKYVTNTGNCGVSSDLHSLGVYIDNIDTFEGKLFGCGVTALFSLLADVTFAPQCNGLNKFSCVNENAKADFESFYLNTVSGNSRLGTVLNNLRVCINTATGLEGDCLEAWKWSVFNAGLLCGQLCVQTGATQKPNNVPQSCDVFPGTNFCDPTICQTSINGEPSCYPESYQNDGEGCVGYVGFRLNSCLQCEECNNGYHMTKIFGRIRRTSGLQSPIRRPDRLVSDIDHTYGLHQP
jgi:hypothetical protein